MKSVNNFNTFYVGQKVDNIDKKVTASINYIVSQKSKDNDIVKRQNLIILLIQLWSLTEGQTKTLISHV